MVNISEESKETKVNLEEFKNELNHIIRPMKDVIRSIYVDYILLKLLPPEDEDHAEFRKYLIETKEILETYNDHINGIIIPYLRVCCTSAYIRKRLKQYSEDIDMCFYRPYFTNEKELCTCIIIDGEMYRDQIEEILDYEGLILKTLVREGKNRSILRTHLLKDDEMPRIIDMVDTFFKHVDKISGQDRKPKP